MQTAQLTLMLLVQANSDEELAADMRASGYSELTGCYVLAERDYDAVYAESNELQGLREVHVRAVATIASADDMRCYDTWIVAYRDAKGNTWLNADDEESVFN